MCYGINQVEAFFLPLTLLCVCCCGNRMTFIAVTVLPATQSAFNLNGLKVNYGLQPTQL